MTKEQNDRLAQLAMKVYCQLSEMFTEEECKYHVDIKDEDFDGAEFFHAMTEAGTMLFNKFTKGDKNNLEFNHIQNQLIMQFSKVEER